MLARGVRASRPCPGAATQAGAEAIKGWAAHVRADAEGEASASTTTPAGTVLAAGAQGVCVQTGSGQLCLTELQRAGGKRLPVADFLRGTPLPPGTVLG